MKAVITIEKTQLTEQIIFPEKLERLVKKKETSNAVEYFPKNKRASEVIRILRDAGVLYQIRFEDIEG